MRPVPNPDSAPGSFWVALLTRGGARDLPLMEKECTDTLPLIFLLMAAIPMTRGLLKEPASASNTAYGAAFRRVSIMNISGGPIWQMIIPIRTASLLAWSTTSAALAGGIRG